MGLDKGQLQRPLRQIQALVTDATQLAMAILAIVGLGSHMVQPKRSASGVQGHGDGPVTVRGSSSVAVLQSAGCWRPIAVVQTAFWQGHPCTRPQPQGHEAEQKA